MKTASASHSRRAGAPPARWTRAEPAQTRSRVTMERFAEVVEELLRTKPFEEISIQEIVGAADRPIGSFYARFAGKDAILPLLYERYHEGLEPLIAARLATVDWERLDFERTVPAIVELLMKLYDERRWLIRALSLFARQNPEALPADIVRRRKGVYDRIVELLLRHAERIRHDDPEAAIRFGLYLVSTIAREKLLFGEAPLSRVTPMTRAALQEQLVRTLHAYLTTGAPR